MTHVQTVTETRFDLSSGGVAAEITGPAGAPLVIGIPGLSANLRSFDVIYDALPGHRRLAFDPRGRGRSDKTPEGTYGWPSHVRDVLEMADRLGAERFDLVGWSMGTWIAMKLCEMAPGRVRRLVLIDGGGLPDEISLTPIYAGIARLGATFPSREAFFALVQSIPFYHPWEPWRRLFDYELRDVEGGVGFSTTDVGPWEDENHRKTQDPYALWPSVTMPALIVRATQQIPPEFGHILTQADLDRFLREVPGARAAEVEANHYTVGMHPDTAAAIAAFLEG
jgi:pimeloyl-ACP methyl ester carboxylesterase